MSPSVDFESTASAVPPLGLDATCSAILAQACALHAVFSKQKRTRHDAGSPCKACCARCLLSLVGGAELLHELLGAGHDGLAAGLQDLAGVEALALLVLAGLDVLAGGLGEDDSIMVKHFSIYLCFLC